MAEFGSPPPYDVVSLELDLVRFYHKVVSDEIRLDPKLNARFLLTVKNAYCKWTLQNGLSDIRFDHPGMRCAYLFLNAPCFSSTAVSHFLELLHENPWLVRRIAARGALSVCCLGGGPAPELVGLLKVLEMVMRLARTSAPPLLVRATVVDVDPGWSSTARWMTQNWWKHFDPSVLKLRLAFVRSDLTEALGDEVREAVRSADVVTSVKFLSSISGTKKRDKIPDMLKGILDCIPVGGILFSISSTRFNCEKALLDAVSSDGHMRTIYGPKRYSVYRLSKPAFDECFRFFCRYYGSLPPTVENRNHVTAWCRSDDRVISQ